MPPGGPACITCREKCRKCDRTKPVCQRCVTKGLECKGYPERFRFAGIATRGKWKNRAVPTVSRGHAVPTQLDIGTDHPDPSHQDSDQQDPSALTSSEDQNVGPLPIIEHFWPQPEGRTVELDDLLMLERTEQLLTHYDKIVCPHQIALPAAGADNPYQVLDIIRSLADPQRLCFSQELRDAVATLSDLKFERVNGCPRDMFLVMGKVIEYAKAHATGKIGTPEFERLLNLCRNEFYSWRLKTDRYPNDDHRWSAVAEAFRHACILHTSRLLDVTQPAEAPIIQNSVAAILDSLAKIPADCHLIELVVMPLFMAGADALSLYARHYVLLRFDHIRAHGGVGNHMSISLLKSVWDGRGRQAKNDSSNIPWVWFTRDAGSERQHDYLII
ncbi:hypothetical protein N7517_001382 [Penicillium concentricum]|uniref:Zn(2)-C6 fungal-type domain-containing protein n=1 Tax=Penicillium concentricum TaxID=293559 RepID=A0A9W9VKX7_9EURO|nr:uncharacterized protein N7517_001382 [Penicillium concentricum]KAJ5383471.1 hypothetical protein N7517_001382 [Penicillium concentricum]